MRVNANGAKGWSGRCLALVGLLLVVLGVPLVASAQSVPTLEVRADRTTLTVGEVLTYRVRVEVPATAAAAQFWVDDAIPRVFRAASSSASAVLIESDGRRRPVPATADGALALRIGRADEGSSLPFRLGPGQALEVRYQVVVGSESVTGRTYENLVQLRDGEGSVALGASVSAAVRVVDDPIFDQGVILGRVFCDVDGDGRASAVDRPLPGARVYLDAGWFADADGDGRVHFSSVDPGTRLLKVDVHSLPPGSTLTTPERVLVTMTPGLPASVSFGVTCVENRITDIEVLPGDSALADAERRRRARYVRVEAAPDTGALEVEGRPVDLLDLEVRAGTQSSPPEPPAFAMAVVEPEAPSGPETVDENQGGLAAMVVGPPAPLAAPHPAVDLRLADDVLVEPLVLRTLAQDGVSRWSIEVVDATTALVVFRDGGVGAPPSEWTWDGTGPGGGVVLEPRSSYRLRVRVFDELSRATASAPVPLHVAGTRVRYRVDERVSQDEFVPGELPRAMQDALRALRPQLEREAPLPIDIEVHIDSLEGLGDEDAVTRQQAEAIADFLVEQMGLPRERVQPRGFGVRRPLYPNIGERTRQTNRRVEIRIVDPQPEILAVRASAFGTTAPRVVANARMLPLRDDGGVATDVPRPPDGLVAFLLRSADGKERSALVAVAAEPQELQLALRPTMGVPVVIDPLRTDVVVGGATTALTGLEASLSPLTQSAVIGGRGLAAPVSFAPDLVGLRVAAWRLEIVSDFGFLAFEQTGEGDVPRALRWDGRTSADIPLPPGLYSVRLTARVQGAGLISTPPVWLLVHEDQATADAAVGFPELPVAVDRVVVDGRAYPGAGPHQLDVPSATGRTILVDIERNGARWVQPIAVPEGFAPVIEQRIPLTPQLLFGVQPVPTRPAPPAASSTPAPATPAAPETEQEDTEDEDPETPVAPTAPPAAPSPFSPFQPISEAGEQPWLHQRPMSLPTMQFRFANPQFQAIGEGANEAAEQAEPPSSSVEAPAVALPNTELPPRYAELETWYRRELDLALSTQEGEDLAAMLAAADAGQIDVQLPPQGVTLEGGTLPVWGTTHPNNRVFVNDREVEVVDGAFRTVLDLHADTDEVRVETLDREGNRGRINWPITVADRRWFLLAIGEGAIGTEDAAVPGANGDTTIRTDSGVMLHGQARIWFRGWMSGREILDGAFRQYSATVWADTAQQDEFEAFYRQAIDPDRSYPIFGDASEPVSETDARGKVFILLSADESSIRLGNFNTNLRGIELVRYDRNLYGGRVEFQRTFAEQYRTEVRAHVARSQPDTVNTIDYLRGTGGSIYYLRNRPIVEGSERVNLIIRDRISGTELLRRPLRRHEDYEFLEREGRLLMKSPVPSTVDDLFLASSYTSSRNTLVGHVVYVEVAYDHQVLQTAQDTSWSTQARQGITQYASVGGTIVEENREGGTFRLWGVEAGVGLNQTTRLDVEYARSFSNDLASSMSDDGGLSWREFREVPGRDEEGDALLIRGRFELADVLPGDRDPILGLEGWYQNQDRGFASHGGALDQGEERYGALARLQITPSHSFRFRHDWARATVEDLFTADDIGDLTEQDRRVTQVQYEYAFNPAVFAVGYQHSFQDDLREDDGFRTDIVTMGLSYRIVRPLRLFVEQELIARGEDPRLIRGADSSATTRVEDRFITGVGASLDLPGDVQLAVSERFRYSGENSTAMGLRMGVGESGSVYVQQRLNHFRDNHGTAAVTAFGGEQRSVTDPGARSWTEYQIDSGISAPRTRAVLGFGKQWQVINNLQLSLAYERSQTLTAESSDSRNHRDTFSAGYDWAALRTLRVGGLFEIRMEQGAPLSPGVGPCLGDDIIGLPNFCRDRLTVVGDRRQLAVLQNAVWSASRDLTLHARLRFITTYNLTLDLVEQQDNAATFAAAWRPVRDDRFAILGHYTWLDQTAPFELQGGEQRRESSHVLAISPIVTLPWNLQFVEKLAWRGMNTRVEGLAPVDNNLVLSIHRLNLLLWSKLEVGGEYRFLHQTLTQDWEHGTLVEAAWRIQEYVRMGVGWNFTRFAEDELGDFSRDAQGAFFRVVATY